MELMALRNRQLDERRKLLNRPSTFSWEQQRQLGSQSIYLAQFSTMIHSLALHVIQFSFSINVTTFSCLPAFILFNKNN